MDLCLHLAPPTLEIFLSGIFLFLFYAKTFSNFLPSLNLFTPLIPGKAFIWYAFAIFSIFYLLFTIDFLALHYLFSQFSSPRNIFFILTKMIKEIEENGESKGESKFESCKIKEKENSSFGKMRAFSNQPEGKWLPIVYLDLLKEKNRVEAKMPIETKIPFYLDFSQKEDIKAALLSSDQKEKVSFQKILKENSMKLLNEICSTDFEKFLSSFNGKNIANPEGCRKIFEIFKNLTPSQIDFEFRKALIGDSQSASKILFFFLHIF